MLELPESYTISRQINENLVGKIINSIEVLHTPHRFAFFKGNVEEYDNMLEGQSIVGAACHGGMIEIDTDDYMIVLADGAYPKYYDNPTRFPTKHQFAVYFDDDTAVFVSIQMYGIIIVSEKGKCDDGYYLSSANAADPLSDAFTYEYFVSLLPDNGKKYSAKAFLATEQRIPGLGNGVLQDILWDAGIDPRMNMRDATEEELHNLYSSVRIILRKMCDDKGRNTETDLFGKKCGYVTQMSKNSLFEPCMKCGNPIHKANYMGGTVYFCEHCQKK